MQHGKDSAQHNKGKSEKSGDHAEEDNNFCHSFYVLMIRVIKYRFGQILSRMEREKNKKFSRACGGKTYKSENGILFVVGGAADAVVNGQTEACFGNG